MHVQCVFKSSMPSTSSLYSLSYCSPILRHYIQDCHVQKVTVHAGVLLSDATALSSPQSPDVVLGERVLRMLISCPECHRIPLTRSVFMFGTIEDTPNIIRTDCSTGEIRKMYAKDSLSILLPLYRQANYCRNGTYAIERRSHCSTWYNH